MQVKKQNSTVPLSKWGFPSVKNISHAVSIYHTFNLIMRGQLEDGGYDRQN